MMIDKQTKPALRIMIKWRYIIQKVIKDYFDYNNTIKNR